LPDAVECCAILGSIHKETTMNRIGILGAVVMALLFAGLRPTALDAADTMPL
jgi:hypothetical protein